MKRMLIVASLSCLLPSCMSAQKVPEFQAASPLLQEEIDTLLRELPFRHGPELITTLKRLIYIGEPAVPSLVESLRAAHPKSRSNAAYVLGEIHDRRVIPALRRGLNDSAPDVAYEVAASLLVLGDWSGIPILIDALEDEDPYHRFKAIRVLAEHTHQDLGYDYRSDRQNRVAAVGRWENWYAGLRQTSMR